MTRRGRLEACLHALRRLPGMVTQRGLLCGCLIILLVTAAQYLDRRIIVNLTESLPLGIYWRVEENPALVRGAIYEFSQPDAIVPYMDKIGPMAPRAHLIKEITGIPGDQVCWSWEVMTVNDVRYPRHTDQPLPPQVGCRRLDAQEVVATGEHPDSCDSRYIGPIDTRRVLYRIVPLVTWR